MFLFARIISSKVLMPLIVAAFLALAAFAGVQTIRLNSAKAESVELSVALNQSTALMSVQSQAVQAAGDERKRLQKALDVASKTADEARKKSSALARKLATAPAPLTCEAAREFGIDAARQIHRERK